MQEKTFHQQRVSNFGLVLITLIKYWKREKMFQNDHLLSWYSGMSFYIRCSKCGKLYSTLFSDTISFFPIGFFRLLFFTCQIINFFPFPVHVERGFLWLCHMKAIFEHSLFVLQNTSNVSDSTFFSFIIYTIADHVLSCILGKFKYNHKKKEKSSFFRIRIDTSSI